MFSKINAVKHAMDYHLERHNVLSSNVANVDTPGYRPVELVRKDVAQGPFAESLRLRTSDTQHLNSGGEQVGNGPDGFAKVEERVVEPGGDDNAVSLEREMSKLAANHLRYETASRIVRQQIGVLRYAAGDAV